ncbi:MAG: MFS transporter [Alistipes sp.]|nr:MFS transporter [Alistipes sp.]
MNKTSVSPLRWIPSLYFAMGLPFVVLNMVAAVMYKDLGVSDAQIAFWTSLIMWPWTIKFLWSPFLELFGSKKLFVVSTQLLSGVLFGVAALALHLPSFFAVTVALFAVVAFSGATHDIAADGVYMSELSTSDQAKYIGWQGAFYNLAKLVATGGLVWLAGWLFERFAASGRAPIAASQSSWTVVLLILAGIMAAAGLWHVRSLPTGGSAASGGRTLADGLQGLREVIVSFFAKKHIRYYIAFIILYRLGEGFVMKIVPLFLKTPLADGGLGLTNQQIGLYYGTFGAGAFLLGSLLAGYYIAGRGLRRTLFSLVCVFNLPFAVYALLAWFQPSSMWIVGGGIVLEYFGYGFGFVGLTLFMMQQVAPGRHQMAHYAFASGIMNLSVMVTGMASGYLSDLLGYRIFFVAVLLATVPAFVMTRLVPFTYDEQTKTK